ncbi:hypothetical protein, partial [Thiobacillus sp.]
DAKQTPFYITKKLMEVPHIDETGHAVRVKQWIIELEAPVDVTALLRANDDEETVIVNAQMASQILESPATVDDAPHALPPIDMPTVQSATARADSKSPQAPKTPSRTPAAGTNAGPSLAQVIEAAHSFGIDAARYEEYADRRWGSGWKINAGGRRGALEELERYRNDPRGYLDKIDTELKVFS